MSDHESLKQLVQNLSFGIAIVNRDSWLIEFENARFFQWFPPIEENAAKGDSLSLRIPEINLERAQQRLEATAAALERHGVNMLAPGHCTGLAPTCFLRSRRPGRCAELSVGSTFAFGPPLTD